MFKQINPVYKGILLALFGYTAFSFSDTCTKFLVSHYPIYQVITIDNAVAALFLLAISAKLGGFGNTFKKENLRVHGLRTMLNLGVNILLAYCLFRLPLANVYTMVFTKPFFAALLALPLYAERITPTRLVAIIIGFAGVVIAIKPGAEGFDPFMMLPLFIALMSALMFICARSLHQPSLFSLGFIPMIGVSLILSPIAATNFVMPAVDHMLIFVLGGICMGAALVCVSLAFRTAAASVVAPFMYVEMVWALIFGLIIFKDWPDIWMLAGAFVIIASGVYLVETERRSFKPDNIL
jgi:drug/metabolite transporter (DMT)-like permease